MKLLHDDHDGSIGGHEDLHDHVHEHKHLHTHDGSTHEHHHLHTHEHEENAGHDHIHEEKELHLPDKEMQTLYALLDHWVDHNISHQEGFKEWSAKAETFGKHETSESITKAVYFMEQANAMLKTAKEKMK